MNYSVMTEREIEIELSTSVSEGLSSFTAHDKLLDNGRNVPEKSYAKSSLRVVLSQITNLYTIAFFVMGIITALCDFSGSIWAWVIFFAVAVINMVSGFLRDNRDRRIALNFDQRRAEECKIIRDGKEMMSDPTLLVKGDIVVLTAGDFVPADIRVLKCESLKADESIFKGRLLPVDKKSEKCDEDTDYFDAPNMLYSGTTVANGWAFGAVVGTGKDTAIARINARNSKKLDMHDKFAKSAKSEKILLFAAIVMAIVVMCYVGFTTKNPQSAMLHACTVALCLIPAPVCLVRMIAIIVCGKRLSREGAAMPEDDFAYQIGLTEYFLFDKGGIITNGEMELEERAVSGRDKLEMAVICSDCEYKNAALTGSDIDKATVNALVNEGVDAERILNENERLLFMPFDEARKLMAVVVKKGDGYRIIVKGSVEVVPTLCSHVSDGDEVMEMSGEALHKLENITSSMAEKGLKIRAVAFRDMEKLPENIEDEIKELIFAGVLGYREVIVRKVREGIKKLEKVFVKPVMVTGDHNITAATIARQAGIIKKESECISFRELADCTDEELLACADKYKVFTSASREDRERLVKALSVSEKVIAVAGEQMCENSVSVNASLILGGSDNADCAIEKADMPAIADALYKSRAMRGNLAYASLLAITVGLSEALVILAMLLTGAEVVPTSLQMLLVNLFVTFVPCAAVAMLAGVHCRLNNQKILALKCMVQGFVAAAAMLLSGNNVIGFVMLYSTLEAGRICISFKNLEKGKLGSIGMVAMALVLTAILVMLNTTIPGQTSVWTTFIAAVVAVVINAVLSVVGLRGRE